MASSKLTLIGLYNYNNSIFDNMNLPAGIDKDTLVDNILLNCGEFETLYPDYDFLKGAIGIWSRKWYRTIEKWVNALSIEYEPLNNYDRSETWTDTITGNSTNQLNESNTETITNDTTSSRKIEGSNTENITGSSTNSGTVSIEGSENGSSTNSGTVSATDSTTGTGTGESINTVSAYDSDSYVPHDKNNNSTTTTNSSTSSTTNESSSSTTNSSTSSTTNESSSSTTNKSTSSNTENVTDSIDNDISKNGSNSSTRTENSNNTSSHTGRMFGNIGVTTSQQMLQSELDIAYWNLYEHITDIFAKEFCIMVY